MPRWLPLALLVGCPRPQVPAPDSRPDPDSPAPDSAVPGDSGTEVVDPSWPVVRINEVMAENRRGITDGVGAHADWIELFNPGTRDVDLDSWTISDDHDEPDRHTLEQRVIPAGGFLLLWADGEPSLGPDHLSFQLDAEGEALGLYAPDGSPVDGLTFGRQAADHAAARALDGGGTWVITASPTPGASNGGPGDDPGEVWPGPPSACALGSDLADPNLREGDAVALRPACEGPLGSDARIEPVSLPSGATWDGQAFSWQTGPASGGRIDLVFAVTTEGAQGEVPLAETVTFWVADQPAAADNVPVDPATYGEEWGLPVLHVAPEGSIGSNYVDAELVWDGTTYPATIKVRGASSAYYPKPGYTIELTAADLPVAPWGVTRDHLVLVSPFDDNSYVRQKLVYDQWAAVASFWGAQRLTPRSFYVVLYLGGVYHGLYLALDHVDDEFLEQQGFDRGSSVYKAVNHDANFYLTGSGGGAKGTLHDGYEKKEGEPEDDFSDLEALVGFTGNADAQALVEGAAAWLDLEEFMDWFLLVHYALAEDSAGKNSYLACAPGETRFRYAPWDFNHAWGQDWRTYRKGSGSLNYHTGSNRVFWAIQNVEAANAALWERYRVMAQPGGPYDPDWIRAQVDAYYAQIEPSAARDWEAWAASYRSYGGWASYRNGMDDWTDYQGEKTYLYQWLDERAALFAARR